MSESANQSQPSNTTPKTPPNPPKGPDAVQFKSKDIGVETAKPQDIFAKQRKEAEKQKQAEKKTRKILIIVFSILGGLIVIGLLIWLIVWLVQINTTPAEDDPVVVDPTILTPGSTEELSNLSNAAQSAFEDAANNGGDAEAAADAIFESATQNDADAAYANQILLSKIMFYGVNGDYASVREIFDEVDPDQLPLDQQIIYYNVGSNAYQEGGDYARAEEYINLVYELSRAEGNGQGGSSE